MWWAGSERGQAVDVLLGRQAALCANGQGAATAHHDANNLPQELLLQVLRAAEPTGGKGRARRQVRLWLTGHWARPFVVEPVPGVKRWSEWQTLAEAMATQHTGLPAPCRVWFSAAPGKTAVLAVATPQALAQDCQQAVLEAGCQLVQIRPWWNVALNHALSSVLAGTGPHTVAAVDWDSLTVLSGAISTTASRSADGFALATTVLPPPAVEQVPGVLSRLGFARGLNLGTVSVLDCVPASDLSVTSTPKKPLAPFLATAAAQGVT